MPWVKIRTLRNELRKFADERLRPISSFLFKRKKKKKRKKETMSTEIFRFQPRDPETAREQFPTKDVFIWVKMKMPHLGLDVFRVTWERCCRFVGEIPSWSRFKRETLLFSDQLGGDKSRGTFWGRKLKQRVSEVARRMGSCNVDPV